MHILIVPDSFKGSLSSIEAAQCIDTGFRRVFSGCTSGLLPVADGGEGTVEALVAGAGGQIVTATVSDPLGRPVEAQFGLLEDGWAVIEMAQASGLPLLAPQERNPGRTSTYGTGQLIRAALDRGCRHMLIGIGGSATNDGGAGMAAALGVRFLDSGSALLPPGGLALADLAQIDLTQLDPRIRDTEFVVASDVTNPLCGSNGASAVYGPQKGASPQQVAALDEALAHYATLLATTCGLDVANLPGAGAAGGLGAGLMAFCSARLRPGIDVIFERLGLEAQIARADLILTGEGRVDATSANGKLLSGVGRLALRHRKPVIALTGSAGEGSQTLEALGIRAVVPIADGPISLEQSLADASRLITDAAERTARLLRIGAELSGHF